MSTRIFKLRLQVLVSVSKEEAMPFTQTYAKQYDNNYLVRDPREDENIPPGHKVVELSVEWDNLVGLMFFVSSLGGQIDLSRTTSELRA